jgi:hypothetical protein
MTPPCGDEQGRLPVSPCCIHRNAFVQSGPYGGNIAAPGRVEQFVGLGKCE